MEHEGPVGRKRQINKREENKQARGLDVIDLLGHSLPLLDYLLVVAFEATTEQYLDRNAGST